MSLGMRNIRSLTGLTLSVLIHGTVGAYFLTHDFKVGEKPKPEKIAMRMAMFEIVAPTPKPTISKVEAEPTPIIASPPFTPLVEEIIKIEKPVLESHVEAIKLVSKPIIEKVALIKPTPKPKESVKKKVKLKKKTIAPKKRAIKKKIKPKKVIAKKKIIIQPTNKIPKKAPIKRKVVEKKRLRALQQRVKVLAQQRASANAKARSQSIVRAAPPTKKTAPQQKTVSNPQIEKQYGLGIRKRIEQKKIYPRKAKRKHKQGVVKVGFVINRNGTISKLRIVHSSGVKSLDKGALQAVKKVGRFPAFPVGINKTSISYVIPISYHLR